MSRSRRAQTAITVAVFVALMAGYVQFSAQPSQAAPGKIIAGYAAGWSISSRAAAAALDGSKISLLIYAFIGINPATNSCTADWTDMESPTTITAAQMADRVAGLKDNKAENPNLKVLLSIGGGGYQPKFEQLTDYTAFANSCYNLMVQYGVDGLDVDYEFPETTAETQRLNGIMSALHTKLGNNGAGTGAKLLTMGAAASGYYGQWIDAATINNYVDYYTTMAYNYHGTWETSLHYNSPTVGCADTSGLCGTSTAYYWNVTRGVPKSKLLLGEGFYGNQYGTAAGCSSAPGSSGYSSATTIDYKTMRTNGMLSGSATAGTGWTRGYNATYQNAYLCNGNTWIGYEDPTSARYRADWIKNNGYPGIMLWELFKDYNNEILNSVCASFTCTTGTVATATPTPVVVSSPPPTPTPTPSGSYPAWSPNSVNYAIGARVTYNGLNYECTMAHTSNVSWTPDAATTLWKRI